MGLSKTGGRKKGTPNKDTLTLENIISISGFDLVIELMQAIQVLPPEQKTSALLKLMEFIYPKRKAVEFDAEHSGNIQVIVKDYRKNSQIQP